MLFILKIINLKMESSISRFICYRLFDDGYINQTKGGGDHEELDILQSDATFLQIKCEPALVLRAAHFILFHIWTTYPASGLIS